MNVTELAHWRYRVKALESDMQTTQKTIRGWTNIDPYILNPPYMDEIDALRQQLEVEGYLLEEAKYMCELGQLERGWLNDND